jgi:hypothetical protein
MTRKTCSTSDVCGLLRAASASAARVGSRRVEFGLFMGLA